MELGEFVQETRARKERDLMAKLERPMTVMALEQVLAQVLAQAFERMALPRLLHWNEGLHFFPRLEGQSVDDQGLFQLQDEHQQHLPAPCPPKVKST